MPHSETSDGLEAIAVIMRLETNLLPVLHAAPALVGARRR